MLLITKEGCKALSGGTESIQMKVELQALMKYCDSSAVDIAFIFFQIPSSKYFQLWDTVLMKTLEL